MIIKLLKYVLILFFILIIILILSPIKDTKIDFTKYKLLSFEEALLNFKNDTGVFPLQKMDLML